MSIDLTKEKAIPLGNVPELPWLQGRGNKQLHAATVHSWCSKGIRGHKLEFTQRGGTRVTTEAALMRFFQGLTEDRNARLRPGLQQPRKDTDNQSHEPRVATQPSL